MDIKESGSSAAVREENVPESIIRCWGAPPVNNDNAHIRLGLPNFERPSCTEKKV